MSNKKERKKAQNKKNRLHQLIFNTVRMRALEEDRIEVEEERRAKPRPTGQKDGDPIWSAKVTTIRNRLNNQKRESKERWNRFSGTSDAGARGR